MRAKTDSAGRTKGIAALRQQMSRQLRVHGVFEDLDPALQQSLKAASDYSDFRLVENERQLESIKAVLAGYIFNDNVVIQGFVPDKKGAMQVVNITHFEAMLKATGMFLNAMNMQNKMWGLYTAPPPEEKKGDTNIKNLTVNMVQELHRIAAKKEPVKTLEATVIDNGQ